MKIHPPTAKMKVVSAIERIQPTAVGVDRRGELVWEGRAMARWQMLMFPVRYIGDFISHWMNRSDLEKRGREPDPTLPSMELHARKGLRKKRPVWGD